MEIRVENQKHAVADEVAALFAVVRPILDGLLHALKADVVAEAGGVEQVKLKMLPRLYRPGDGDCGICFEYAVHDAMRRGDSSVLERVDASLALCNVPGGSLSSILFGAEKTGSQQIIATAKEALTTESLLMYGQRGRPASLKRHIDAIAQAFRRPNARLNLPQSISGIWKADLFLGKTDTDKWVGTSVKINPMQLQPVRGLRVGIIPVKQGESDLPSKDDTKNLVVCPLLHDGEFMEIFYGGWGIVQQFIAADAKLPKDRRPPRGRHAAARAVRPPLDRPRSPQLPACGALRGGVGGPRSAGRARGPRQKRSDQRRRDDRAREAAGRSLAPGPAASQPRRMPTLAARRRGLPAPAAAAGAGRRRLIGGERMDGNENDAGQELIGPEPWRVESLRDYDGPPPLPVEAVTAELRPQDGWEVAYGVHMGRFDGETRCVPVTIASHPELGTYQWSRSRQIARREVRNDPAAPTELSCTPRLSREPVRW